MPNELNRQQQAAVASPSPRLLILAGAGSGKTTVLLQRALALADDFPRVRLLTFSRRAARVLKARLAASGAHPLTIDRIEIDTHHGAALGILRRHGHPSLPATWTVVDRVEQDAVEKGTTPEAAKAALRRAGQLTYDELIPLACATLARYEVVQAEGGGALLIDEGQDSCREEWDLDEALLPESWTVVGDAAQRIYGWRGAVELPLRWPRVELTCNYRSTGEICRLANCLDIPGRVALYASEPIVGVPSQLWELASDEAIVADLLTKTDLRARPEGWALLTRTNARAEKLADLLTRDGVRVHCPSKAAKVWDTPRARLLVDHLQVVANPHASPSLRRCLAAAGWSETHLLRAEAERAKTAQSLWDWACSTEHPDTVAGRLLNQLYVLRDNDVGCGAVAWALNCVDLTLSMPPLSVPDFLAWLASPDRDETQPDVEGACYVGSLHSAKGEEWDQVCIVGLEEGSLPLMRGGKGRDPFEALAEERRLLYVGITRARHRVILARAEEKAGGSYGSMRGGGVTYPAPSRFLSELGF